MKKEYFGPWNTGIVFAADLPSSEENFRILDQISDLIDVIKLSGFLAFKESVSCIRAFKKRYQKPIFADFKIADVPHTNEKIIEMVREEGGDAVMVHGIIGPDGIESCQKAAQERLGIIMQIELTNPGGLIFTSPIALDLAKLAASMGVYGIQAPGNRPEKIAAIRNIVGPDTTIVCCGVGHQGGTYQSVLQAGGNYPIIGRSIYTSANPRLQIQQILKETL